jgi:hypothetical protein
LEIIPKATAHTSNAWIHYAFIAKIHFHCVSFRDVVRFLSKKKMNASEATWNLSLFYPLHYICSTTCRCASSWHLIGVKEKCGKLFSKMARRFNHMNGFAQSLTHLLSICYFCSFYANLNFTLDNIFRSSHTHTWTL